MQQIESIIETVRLRKSVHAPEVKGKSKLISKFANAAFTLTLPKYDKHFRTEKCIKCGVCIKSCPNNNIVMGDNGPQWNQG